MGDQPLDELVIQFDWIGGLELETLPFEAKWGTYLRTSPPNPNQDSPERMNAGLSLVQHLSPLGGETPNRNDLLVSTTRHQNATIRHHNGTQKEETGP